MNREKKTKVKFHSTIIYPGFSTNLEYSGITVVGNNTYASSLFELWPVVAECCAKCMSQTKEVALQNTLRIGNDFTKQES